MRILVEILEVQVLPAVDGRQARVALQLVAGLLDNMATRIEESSEMQAREREFLLMLEQTMPSTLSHFAPAGPQPESSRTDRRLSSVLRSLRANPTVITEAAVSDWLEICRRTLKDRSEIQARLMRPTRYLTSQIR
jgi:hypothetical protein